MPVGGGLLFPSPCQLLFTCYKLQATSYQLLATNYQLLVTSTDDGFCASGSTSTASTGTGTSACGLGPLTKYPDTIRLWIVFSRILGHKPQEPCCKVLRIIFPIVHRFISFTVKFDLDEITLQRKDFLAQRGVLSLFTPKPNLVNTCASQRLCTNTFHIYRQQIQLRECSVIKSGGKFNSICTCCNDEWRCLDMYTKC